MSKLTSEMSHKKRIEENLTFIDNQEEKEATEQSIRIKNKMAEIEEIRNKILEEKIKSYRKNDEKWLSKLKEIQHKFREQNRDAMEKAKKYREDSENYWKSKEKKFQDLERQNYENYENSRIQASELRNFNKSYEERRMSDKKFYLNHRKSLNTEKSPKKKYSSILNIDSQIKAHQFRSNTIQREKEAEMFQKSMEKLDRIEQKRKERSDKLLKESLAKVEKPLKERQIEDKYSSERKIEKERRNKTSLLKMEKNKESLDNVIKYHMLNKERIEDFEFEQRGSILESAALKNKKDRILKMIKNKIKDMKVNVMISQGSNTKLANH